jgi:hypothetical protein
MIANDRLAAMVAHNFLGRRSAGIIARGTMGVVVGLAGRANIAGVRLGRGGDANKQGGGGERGDLRHGYRPRLSYHLILLGFSQTRFGT